MRTQLDQSRWEQAEMTDNEGRLARFPFPLSGVCPASLSKLDGDDLTWVFTMHMCYHGDVSTDEMLDYFTKIKSGDGVLRFARRYGVLELCGHGHHRHEDATECPEPRRPSPVEYPDDEAEGWLFREPLSGWFRHVQVVNSILRVAAALRLDEAQSPEDWQTIKDDELLGYPFRRHDLSLGWEGLSYVLNTWLRAGNVSPEVSTQDGRRKITFGGDTWSTLGFQTALAVTGEGRTAVCGGCNRVYSRLRKPQRGRRNFCQECNEDGTAARMRQRDYAERHPGRVLAKSRKERSQTARARIAEQGKGDQ